MTLEMFLLKRMKLKLEDIKKDALVLMLKVVVVKLVKAMALLK